MSIGGDDLLAQIENDNPKLGQYLRYHVKAIETLATNTGASATGFVPAPQPPEGMTVNPIGPEHVQITIQHSAPVNKGAEYFTEVATDPAFTNPRVEHHGATRSPVNPIFLPTKDLAGDTHNYYLRSYVQQPGGPPSTPHEYVGNPITMTGATVANHTPSTGSGTAAPDGSQGGSGWGRVLQRPAVAPKRSV
jgi:hypothetical protein